MPDYRLSPADHEALDVAAATLRLVRVGLGYDDEFWGRPFGTPSEERTQEDLEYAGHALAEAMEVLQEVIDRHAGESEERAAVAESTTVRLTSLVVQRADYDRDSGNRPD